MISAIYEAIGRMVVGLLWFRFRRQIQLAGGLVVVLVVGLGYLAAKRTPPEG